MTNIGKARPRKRQVLEAVAMLEASARSWEEEARQQPRGSFERGHLFGIAQDQRERANRLADGLRAPARRAS